MIRWLIRSFLSDKFPEADIPQVTQLSAVQRMLAENVVQWKDKWVEQGIAQGMERGERKLFRRSIERRFGDVHPELLAKIETASTQQIEAWIDKLFTAENIDEIFE